MFFKERIKSAIDKKGRMAALSGNNRTQSIQIVRGNDQVVFFNIDIPERIGIAV